MNTNPQDFLIFVKSIPKEIMENVWFFPIWANSKKPEAKTELKNNADLRLTASQSYQRLKNGSNVGIYGLPGGLMFLDVDVYQEKYLCSDELFDAIQLIPTLSVQTRNGGLQKYFLNDGKYANQLIKENGKIIGELRTNWQYVVSPGSYVPTDENNARGDGTYRLEKISRSILEFQPIIGLDKLAMFDDSLESKKSKSDKNRQKSNDAEKRTWNNDSVKAERISNEDYKKMMENRVRRMR